jgi:hypothetical protein
MQNCSALFILYIINNEWTQLDGAKAKEKVERKGSKTHFRGSGT